MGDRLSSERETRGGLLGLRLEEARARDFFTWFSLVEIGLAETAAGRVVEFKPEGEKFRELVTVRATLDGGGRIVKLALALARAFVDHGSDGVFARDIAKSLLRGAFGDDAPTEVSRLADEIEFNYVSDRPVLVSSSRPRPRLPDAPSPGYLTYLGRRPSFENEDARGKLTLSNRAGGPPAVLTITVESRA